VKNNIFFIAGVHGVGKTTLCAELSKDLCIPAYTASEIIDKTIAEKKIMRSEVENNQKLLIEGLFVLLKSTDIILDGHFVLLGQEGEVIKIAIDTFKDINPKVIFVLTAPPQEIYKRLLERDNTHYSLETLERLQREEVSHAQDVSKILEIPLYVLENSKNNLVTELIKKYMEK
jgi:adenylate kinase